MSHVIILDGTMSRLWPGHETNAGLTFKLLQEVPRGVTLYYAPGLQWTDWRAAGAVLLGRGINAQIRDAYGALASRYRPGDRIYLLGYSRGAYAVRSLAGIIDQIGLLRADAATERHITQIYHHYRLDPQSAAARTFAKLHCHAGSEHPVAIEMIGVWDTVKALGLNLPFARGLAKSQHAFHSHALGPSVRHGFHALARDETRHAYAPVMWETAQDWPGHVEQMWFRGSHGDIGGQLSGYLAARPLSNIPLVWMLEKLEQCDLPPPAGWRGRFVQDPMAPSAGTWRGYSGLFLRRRRRKIGQDPSERLHPSVAIARQRPNILLAWWRGQDRSSWPLK